jgi:hypothetical protein
MVLPDFAACQSYPPKISLRFYSAGLPTPTQYLCKIHQRADGAQFPEMEASDMEGVFKAEIIDGHSWRPHVIAACFW